MSDRKDFPEAEKLDTGSKAFNLLLGGGLRTNAITDIFGEAATGKTQFAFQNALMASIGKMDGNRKNPSAIFIDCSGSFRPERITEMAETRGISKDFEPLDHIYTYYVRSVSEQQEANDKVLSSDFFHGCRLLIIDDVTANFAAEFPGTMEDENDSSFITRYYELSKYARKLANIANSLNMSVLLTNSVRSRISGNEEATVVETTGDIISQFTLFRVHFSKKGRKRKATVIDPLLTRKEVEFEIVTKGIMP